MTCVTWAPAFAMCDPEGKAWGRGEPNRRAGMSLQCWAQQGGLGRSTLSPLDLCL